MLKIGLLERIHLVLFSYVILQYFTCNPTGKKQIDPDTGLIYFKYDFGYEFGIVLPGEEKPGAPRKIFTGPSKKEEGAVDFPIIHEKSQKQKVSKLKSVKWEPTSESEMSEIESEKVHRGLPLARFRLRTPSPSPSPSVQSLSPYPAGSDVFSNCLKLLLLACSSFTRLSPHTFLTCLAVNNTTKCGFRLIITVV